MSKKKECSKGGKWRKERLIVKIKKIEVDNLGIQKKDMSTILVRVINNKDKFILKSDLTKWRKISSKYLVFVTWVSI